MPLDGRIPLAHFLTGDCMLRTLLRAKESIRQAVPLHYRPLISRWKSRCFGYRQRSYSQHGEDLLLRALLGPRTHGFYVDVGAHHPKFLSNSYYFYRRGWRGINIDPIPDVMGKFRRARKKDINLELALSEKRGTSTLYQFSDSCRNTLCHETAEELKQDPNFVFLNEQQISTDTLAQVLDEHLPPDTQIDFLSIDAENWDLPILKGNDWSRFRPAVIIVEVNHFSLLDPEKNDVYQFLLQQGYHLAYVVMTNLFFVSDPSLCVSK